MFVSFVSNPWARIILTKDTFESHIYIDPDSYTAVVRGVADLYP